MTSRIHVLYSVPDVQELIRQYLCEFEVDLIYIVRRFFIFGKGIWLVAKFTVYHLRK